MAHDVNGHPYCPHRDPCRRWWCVHRFLVVLLTIWTLIIGLVAMTGGPTRSLERGAMICRDLDGDGIVDSASCRQIW
ncbi:hypothetical protein UA75_23480 [Actinoalloteichus sp. GBA129-24]|uniref:Uncharacterized protein n=1 Tax=Actinoalloteichus fjordicus TaxID=1612552 RepID=A0AAC9PU04_9PSEU|nr:hypothetical protein UA74_22970 [Actinoalloteichus fjordicus]APU22678.1 hypothetical protein UA75_23480 [Actinoalloteichus sp. GBA129-24]